MKTSTSALAGNVAHRGLGPDTLGARVSLADNVAIDNDNGDSVADPPAQPLSEKSIFVAAN